MIYTVTFNPSLDYIVRADHFRAGVINRTTYENILPGGKGINVSIVLKNMGHESTALGFIAGFTGREICTRLALKMKSDEETEINGQGPVITAEALEALYARLDTLQADDLLVISGSIPSTLPDDVYERIMARLDGRGIRIVVDAERGLLVNVLKYHPYLIKPNNIELGEIYGVTLKTQDEVIPYAKKLQERGARNVLISMAGEGAVFISEKGDVLRSPAPKGTLVNSVGAGDSMVAGFLTGMIETGDFEQAFRMGLCTGSASAFSENLATRPEVEALLKTI